MPHWCGHNAHSADAVLVSIWYACLLFCHVAIFVSRFFCSGPLIRLPISTSALSQVSMHVSLWSVSVCLTDCLPVSPFCLFSLSISLSLLLARALSLSLYLSPRSFFLPPSFHPSSTSLPPYHSLFLTLSLFRAHTPKHTKQSHTRILLACIPI